MVGVVADSPGLARAREFGLKTTADGVDGMLPTLKEDGVQICFDATSAYVHADNSRKVNSLGAVMIDLTPAAIGPFCVPPVNLAAAVAEKAMKNSGGKLTTFEMALKTAFTDMAKDTIMIRKTRGTEEPKRELPLRDRLLDLEFAL